MNKDEKIIDKILNSSKYRGIYRPTIERIVDELKGKYSDKDMEKAVRKKMHQVWGAYVKKINFGRLGQDFTDCLESSDATKCTLPILKLQTSTDERIFLLDNFYKSIWKVTGIPRVVFEPACGLNALTYYWMGEGVKYVGYDVDQRQIDFVNSIFDISDSSENAVVRLGDIFEEKYLEADVTMFLKVLILLERQKKGSSLEVLKKCKSKYIVVSFPTRSISGKNKGMKKYYTNYFMDLISEEKWKVEKMEFDGELVFVVEK